MVALLANMERWSLARAPATQRQAGQVALRLAGVLLPFGVFFTVAFLALGQWSAAACTAVSTVAVAMAPVAMRFGSVAIARDGLLGSLVSALILPTVWLGGLATASIAWLTVVILGAALLGGRRSTLIWTGTSIAGVWALLALHIGGLVRQELSAAVFWTLGALTYTGLFVVVGAWVTNALEVDAARRAAEASSEAKSQFLSRMSHELRTPLNAVIGYAELLEEDAQADARVDLRRIRQAGRHLLAMVNDVLDLAKVEAGKLELMVEAVPMGDLAREVLSLAQPLLLEKGNRGSVSGDGTVHGDRVRLRQCLINLVGNAARFTERGEIAIRVRELGPRVKVEVSDTGVGMTEAQLSRVFEPFVQGDATTSQTHGGTGLGLAIVRQLAEAHHGSVSASSVPGRGSVFVLDLPRSV